MPRKSRAPQKWKCTPGRPLRVGSTIFKVSRPCTLTIIARETIRRIRKGREEVEIVEESTGS